MADTAIPITAGTGTNVDTRTEGTNGNHRQVVVLGDPATNAGVAPVDATKGLAVDLSATGANTNKLLVTPDLPAGAATATKQDTGNTSVASIDTKTPALGQALSASSVPVVLPATQITTLTPPAAITGFATAAKQPALGTAGTASADVLTVQGKAAMTPLLVDGSAVTQPVSGSVTADTELPAAALLADATALPTTPIVGGANMTRNGAGTLDMQRSVVNGTNTSGAGVAAAGLVGQFDDVAPTSITENQFGNVRMSANRNLYGTIRDAAGNERGANVTAGGALQTDSSATTQPVSGSLTTVSTVTNLSQLGGTAVAMNTGVRSAGTQRVTIATDDVVPVTGTFWQTTQPVSISGNQATNTVQLNGTTIDTNSGVKSGGTQRVVLATDQPNLTTPFNVNTIAQATGGYTPAKLISAATTNATSAKGSAGTLGFMSAGNISGSPRYIKLYNKASAPTVGTDVPVQVYVVPGNTAGSGFMVPLSGEGLNFSTGIAFAITAGIADTDTTAVGANEVALSYGTA